MVMEVLISMVTFKKGSGGEQDTQLSEGWHVKQREQKEQNSWGVEIPGVFEELH